MHSSTILTLIAAIVSLPVIAAAMPGVAAANPNLPAASGTMTVAGLTAPVTVARDRLGIPDIRGESFLDVIRAQGFVHAQDRYFQMDAARRLAAGTLSEVVGSATLDFDQKYRRYQFASLAKKIVASLNTAERDLLRAYTEGVNAGLASLPVPPPEYGMLNVKPEPWREHDAILIIYIMFDMLHLEANFEKRLGVMRDALPEELYEFLTPRGSRFDVPLIVEDGNPGNDWKPLPIPGPEVIDLRKHSAAAPDLHAHDLVRTIDIALGSNNWAVAGSRSAHGVAIVANDPHLQLTAPGIWYRTQLSWTDNSAGGLTLPGVPGIVIGSTQHVAWGFTNTMGDFQDLIVIEVHPDDPNLYRTPDGYEAFEEVVETIHVRGRGNERLTLRTTRWGIVTDKDHRGRPLVLKWTALIEPEEGETINLGLLDLLEAKTIEQAVESARNWFGPSQNMVIAHRDGSIAWLVTGYLPDRFPDDFDGRYPRSWADGDIGWRGPLPEDNRPVLINPDSGILFTANNRTVNLARAQRLGGVWVTGERAGRIKELLGEQEKFDEDDLFKMQLDTRVRVFDYYRDLILESLKNGHGADSLTIAEHVEVIVDLLESWNGTADADQPAMRILDTFRQTLHWMVIYPLVAQCREHDSGFFYWWFMQEEPVRRILEERPAHLLPAGYASWDALIAAVVQQTIRSLTHERHEGGLRMTWGEANRARISHPLVEALPPNLASAFRRTLAMPETPQPGHPFAVRVASGSFGASARMVVSPGRKERGILQTPAGQSGHFQSPHFRDSHEYWADGRKVSFLPGEPNATLVLEPAAEPDLAAP